MPIFELKKSRFGAFCGYILAFFSLFFGYILLDIAPNHSGLKMYIGYFGAVLFICGGFVMFFKILNFTKITFFDEKIEFCFKTKIINKNYNQIQKIINFPQFYIKKNWRFYLLLNMKFPIIFCLDDRTLAIQFYFFIPSDLRKISEILKAKGVEING